VPDERFGESVTALVQFEPGVADPGQAELIGWVRERLAGYKAPKAVIEVDTIGRSPSGKVDYRRLRERAIESLGGVGSQG
jgi:fatty-acyl-CoA synthase